MSKRFTKSLITGALFLTIVGFATPTYAASGPLRFFSPFWWLGFGRQSQQETSKAIPSPGVTEEYVKENMPVEIVPIDSPEPLALPKVETQLDPALFGAETVMAKKETPKKIVAGWLVPWGDDSFNSFKDNLDTLTEVHPFVYTVGGDGVSVVLDAGEWHKSEVMHLAKENNILVLPTISGDVNHSDLMLNDPAKRAAHIDEIMRVIEVNGYDGFNIDYEGFLNGYNRDVYAQFLTNLSQRLHEKNKLLAFSVEAFNRKQDWDTIGKVVDRFMLMGYDYHSARGPEVGPIGPASWLQEVIDYTATRVPKEKIVLGLGTYGYSWIHNGAQYVSEAVSYQDALDISKEMGAEIKRQDDAPYFTYSRGAGNRYLYFEDAVSTQPKIELAGKSDIGGIAFWRLGTEDVNIWNGITETLNK